MLITPPQLLITDDDRAFRETLRGVFEPRGFRLFTAGDGSEALEIIQHRPVDLLVTDMHMPRMTGLEMIRRVKQVRLSLPCILLSGNLDDGLVEEAREVAFSVLPKPVRSSDITRTVYQALQAVYGWDVNDLPHQG